MNNKIIFRLSLIALLCCFIFQYAPNRAIGQFSEEKIKNKDNSIYAGATNSIYQQNESYNIDLGAINAYNEAHAFKEDNVYTFLQGPVAWETQTPWSGPWCYEYLDGGYFGGFGCGMCCMANIYSSLSPYECSPLDMYDYAREVSGYQPTYKSGAISWGDLKTTLKKAGLPCDVYYKADTYEEFQTQMTEAKSAIVLVSSYEDDSFWTDTSGHYVNLWLYNPDDDTVFLSEPGDPDNNRTRIPLEYVYKALKTTSKFQYLLVDDYDEASNLWKHNGIDIEWTRP